MSLPPDDLQRICRLALLRPAPIEIINPLAPAHLIIGWSIWPDENWTKGDSRALLRMIERRAGLNWRKVQRGYRIGGI